MYMYLVGGDWNMIGLCFHIYWEYLIIPIYELIFFRGGETTNQCLFIARFKKQPKCIQMLGEVLLK